jgi:hypothetical protein
MSTIEFMGVFVSLTEPALQAKMEVFPNPSNGTFTIRLDGEYEVSIFNNMSVVVYRETISHTEQLNLQNLSPGIYVIQATSDLKSAVSRIIIR